MYKSTSIFNAEKIQCFDHILVGFVLTTCIQQYLMNLLCQSDQHKSTYDSLEVPSFNLI